MDTVYTIHLRSYGFLHPGRERMRQVLKRAWPHIPGSTLYGAIAAALIRLDGLDPDRPLQGAGDFHALLRAVSAQEIRFAPLIVSQERVKTAVDYCRAALAPIVGPPLLQAVPHAPLNREREQIHDNHLYAYAAHRPVVDYYGFVVATSGTETLLRRGLRLLPVLPFGGKGKFALVEGAVIECQARADFEAAFAAALRPGVERENESWVQLLTPMLMGQGGKDWPLVNADQHVVRRLKRYRIWQSGFVYRWTGPGAAAITRAGGERYNVAAGQEMLPGAQDDIAGYPGGVESQPATGIPEGSRFHLLPQGRAPQEIARVFVEGVGHPGWRYLGWGQLVVEWL